MAAESQKQVDRGIVTVWNVNAMCIVGACIGVAALVFTWIFIPLTMPEPAPLSPRHTPTLINMIVNDIDHLYLASAIMFLLGTVVAFVSPLGGISQLASIMLFAYGIIQSGFRQPLDGIDQQQELRIGMVLGIVSCAVVLMSLFRPIGMGKLRPASSRNIRLVERLLTVSSSTLVKEPMR